MLVNIFLKRKVKRALQNKNLQRALKNALNHYNKNFASAKENLDWESLTQRVREIKKRCVSKIPELLEKFAKEAEKAGCKVFITENAESALKYIGDLVIRKGEKLVVKAKSMLSEEIELNNYLESLGVKVVETDLGEWIVQIASEKPSHITAPALHKTKENVAELFSKYLGREIKPDIHELVKIARKELRKFFLEAGIGISGANIAIAETGTIIIVSNEGNARLVTSLPSVHICLLTPEKIVETIEDASSILKVLPKIATGQKITSYISFITGPSRTADIEKEIVLGAHGPEEVHIVIISDKRISLREDPLWKNVLYCIKCGSCMTVCPVYGKVGGHVFGAPPYPGGIGLAITSAIKGGKEVSSILDLCSDCKKCDSHCPVKIPISELIIDLKKKRGVDIIDKIILSALKNSRFISTFNSIISILQIPFVKNDFLNLPFSSTKLFPAFKTKKHKIQERGDVLLFPGCLIKNFYLDILDSALNLIRKSGMEALISDELLCCGAPAYHLGDFPSFKKLAEKNLRVFEKISPEYIITLCPTGNGIMRKEYPLILKEGENWKDRIFDVSKFLTMRGIKEVSSSAKIYFHHPCHSLNFAKIKREPIELLKKVGFDVYEEEFPTCCGFAGAFSFQFPEISSKMLQEKLRSIEESSSDFVVTSCPGCILNIRGGFAKLGNKIPVFHIVEILDKFSS
ncbi:MAG: LUD domain-containing protein [Candidatus Aminicenantia bacterium]